MWTVIEFLEVRVVLIIINLLNLIRNNLFVNLCTVVKNVQIASLVTKRIMCVLVKESENSVKKL